MQPAAAGHADARELVDVLHARGQRATPQRIVVLRALRRRGRHTTADELRRSLRHELPGTSIPTVYAALELLVELGFARRVDAGGGAVLYDPRTDRHHHTVCRRCGRVDDLDARVDLRPVQAAAAEAGFLARDVDVLVSGLCRRCARAAAASGPAAAASGPAAAASRPAAATSGPAAAAIEPAAATSEPAAAAASARAAPPAGPSGAPG